MKNLNKYFGLFCLSALVSVSACKSSKKQKSISGFLVPNCSLPNVQLCIPECEVVNAAKNTAVQQELTSGINLSNFSLAGCAGQFEIIYNCYLQNLGNNACATLESIIQSDNFKLVLENPNCQCSTLFS